MQLQGRAEERISAGYSSSLQAETDNCPAWMLLELEKNLGSHLGCPTDFGCLVTATTVPFHL